MVDNVAEQRAGGNPADCGERPQRKDERCQQPVQRRPASAAADRCRAAPRPAADATAAAPPQSAATRRAPAPPRLPASASAMISQEIDRKNKARRGAEAFQGRDRRCFAGDVAAHRIADAEAADQQRRQPDQRQEQRHPVDQPLQIGRGSAKSRGVRQPASGKAARAACSHRTRRRPRAAAADDNR